MDPYLTTCHKINASYNKDLKSKTKVCKYQKKIYECMNEDGLLKQNIKSRNNKGKRKNAQFGFIILNLCMMRDTINKVERFKGLNL